jgi:hypothetical protein
MCVCEYICMMMFVVFYRPYTKIWDKNLSISAHCAHVCYTGCMYVWWCCGVLRTHTHTHTHTYIPECIHTFGVLNGKLVLQSFSHCHSINVCMHKCMYVCMYVYMFFYMYVCMYANVRIFLSWTERSSFNLSVTATA